MNHDEMTMILENIGYESFMAIPTKPSAQFYVLKCHGHFIMIHGVPSNVTVTSRKETDKKLFKNSDNQNQFSRAHLPSAH